MDQKPSCLLTVDPDARSSDRTCSVSTSSEACLCPPDGGDIPFSADAKSASAFKSSTVRSCLAAARTRDAEGAFDEPSADRFDEGLWDAAIVVPHAATPLKVMSIRH